MKTINNSMSLVGLETDLLNLKPTSSEGVTTLSLRSTPDALYRSGYEPIYCHVDERGESTIFAVTTDAGSGGVYFLATIDHGDYHTVTSVRERPLCMIADGPRVIMMLSDGPHILERGDDDVWRSLGKREEPAEIQFSVAECGTLQTVTDDVSVDVTDSARPHITDSGQKRLSKALADAYTNLARQALAGGMWVQPLVVSYTLRDGAGRAIATSAPRLIAPYGRQCTDEIRMDVTRSGSVLEIGSIPLAVDAYKIRLAIPDYRHMSVWNREVAQIDINVWPQFHPVDANAEAACRVVRTPQGATVYISLPGRYAAEDERAIAKMLARREKIPHSTYRFSSDAMGTTVEILPQEVVDPADETAVITKANAVDVTPKADDFSTNLINLTGGENTFSARRVIRSGDSVVWADITPVSSAGRGIGSYTHSASGQGYWWSTIVTELADGRRLWRYDEADAGRPLTLQPLITSPDPLARRISIWVQSDSETRYGSFALTPSDDRTFAFYLNPSLSPISLSAENPPDIPDEVGSERIGSRIPGAVLCAHASNPLMGVAATSVTSTTIVDLSPALHTYSSWEFSRCHCYSFSPEGIHAICFENTRPKVSASLISSKPVASQQCVAYTPGGVMVVTTDGLYRLVGSRLKLIDLPAKALKIAWSDVLNELWVLTPDGVAVWNPSDGRLYRYDRAPNERSLLAGAGHLFLSTPAGTYHLDATSPVTESHFALTAVAKMPPLSRVIGLRIDMTASHFCGSVAVKAHRGAGADSAVTIGRLNIDGPIDKPITMRLFAPPREWCTLEIQGRSSPNLRISDYNIIFNL